MSVESKQVVDQDATWNEGRPRPRPHCVRWRNSPSERTHQPLPLFGVCLLCQGHIVLDGDQAPSPERGTAAPPTFRPMSIVAKRSPISATAELLLEVHCSSCCPTTCIRTSKGTQNHVSRKFTHWPHAVLVHKLTPDALPFMLALRGQCLLQCNTLRLNTFSLTRH